MEFRRDRNPCECHGTRISNSGGGIKKSPKTDVKKVVTQSERPRLFKSETLPRPVRKLAVSDGHPFFSRRNQIVNIFGEKGGGGKGVSGSKIVDSPPNDPPPDDPPPPFDPNDIHNIGDNNIVPDGPDNSKTAIFSQSQDNFETDDSPDGGFHFTIPVFRLPDAFEDPKKKIRQILVDDPCHVPPPERCEEECYPPHIPTYMWAVLPVSQNDEAANWYSKMYYSKNASFIYYKYGSIGGDFQQWFSKADTWYAGISAYESYVAPLRQLRDDGHAEIADAIYFAIQQAWSLMANAAYAALGIDIVVLESVAVLNILASLGNDSVLLRQVKEIISGGIGFFATGPADDPTSLLASASAESLEQFIELCDVKTELMYYTMLQEYLYMVMRVQTQVGGHDGAILDKDGQLWNGKGYGFRCSLDEDAYLSTFRILSGLRGRLQDDLRN
jgi:hypothetical protein